MNKFLFYSLFLLMMSQFAVRIVTGLNFDRFAHKAPDAHELPERR